VSETGTDLAAETRGSGRPIFSARDVEEALQRTWKWLMVAGLVAIAAGVLAILLPLASSLAVATILGVLFLFQAGALLVDAFAVRTTAGRRLLRILFAVLYAVAGIYLLVAPLSGTITLTLVIGVLFLVEGAFRIAAALADRTTPARGWQLGTGLLAVLLGVLVVASWPSSSSWVIGTLVGVNLLFWGWNMVALAAAGSRIWKEVHRPDPSPRRV
jgi:uncharacterized membrane protein HdeD (DUF308 family)